MNNEFPNLTYKYIITKLKNNVNTVRTRDKPPKSNIKYQNKYGFNVDDIEEKKECIDKNSIIREITNNLSKYYKKTYEIKNFRYDKIKFSTGDIVKLLRYDKEYGIILKGDEKTKNKFFSILMHDGSCAFEKYSDLEYIINLLNLEEYKNSEYKI